MDIVINEQGDTLVRMSYSDAKTILEDLLHYEYADSLLNEYKLRDELNSEKINLQINQIDVLTDKVTNLEHMVNNFNKVLENKDAELMLKDEIIKEQRKEIRKQKFLKMVGFSTSIILPIVTLLLIV